MTEDGLAILDRERDKMGLSRSAMFEVLIRTWARDQQRVEAGAGQDRAAGASRRPKRGAQKKRR